MATDIWYTTNAIKWMVLILEERFGHVFTLRPEPNGKIIELSLLDHSDSITFILDGSTFIRSDSDLPCSIWNAAAEGWNTVLEPGLPTPGAFTLVTPLIELNSKGYKVNYDILGLTYWILTRQEEVGRTDLDAHGRFPATSSHAFRHGYLERPIIDEWMYLIRQLISRTWPGLQLKQHTFNMMVSHDVDAPSRYGFTTAKGLLFKMAGDVVKHGNIRNAIKAPWIRFNSYKSIHHDDPFNTFEWIMDVSDYNKLTSTFYFICGRTSNFDADYEIDHKAIRLLMKRIHERGHLIGLHPSYGTFKNPDLLVQEALKLRKVMSEENILQKNLGGRMHYLRWEQPSTLCAWEVAGMQYDSTLGYADLPGFRCGTCYEYLAFDPQAKKILNLRIRPLITMECTVMDTRYMGLGTSENSYAKFISLKKTCKAVNGTYTLLWHNSELEKKSKKKLYSSVIESF